MQKWRIRDRTRHAAQTSERRGADLQQRSERLADETAEEREARLRQMTASNHARLATETAEEREARLQSTSEAQTSTGHAGTAPIVSTIFCPN